MPGKSTAVQTGEQLKHAVTQAGVSLHLRVETEVKVGRRVWGSRRHIDVVLTHPETRARLGIECKYQGVGGTAEEKIPVTVEDIKAWPIKGIVVIAGPGFSENMRGYLLSTGIVVDLEDLEEWLKLYFGL